MKGEPTIDRLPGRWLRGIAERAASKATRERVLFPLLADLQFEHARAQGGWARALILARGAVAFWRALGITWMVDSGHHLWANAWGTSEEEARATKRLFARVGLGVTVVSVLLLGQQYRLLRHLSAGGAVALLVPSVAALAIPIGLLFALSLGSVKAPAERRRARLWVGAVSGLATFAIAAWLTPVANREFRQRVTGILAPESTGPLVPGDREMSFDDLAARSAELHGEGRAQEAARFELEWHKKLALGASCLALALAAGAIASTLKKRLTRCVAGFAVVSVAYALLRTGEQAADAGHLAPALAMWGPVVVVGVVGLALLRPALASAGRPGTTGSAEG